ncbi:MAG: ribonuclease P protein component [Actinomycetota bacterium]
MLPREHRLRSNREFQRVYRVGKSWAHPLAALHLAPLSGNRRFGISVSKKVGNAVLRNRVRRRLREVVRAALPDLRTGFDAVIVARAAAADADFEALSQSVAELFRRARLIREPGEPPDTLYQLPAGGRPPRSRGAQHPTGGAREIRPEPMP